MPIKYGITTYWMFISNDRDINMVDKVGTQWLLKIFEIWMCDCKVGCTRYITVGTTQLHPGSMHHYVRYCQAGLQRAAWIYIYQKYKYKIIHSHGTRLHRSQNIILGHDSVSRDSQTQNRVFARARGGGLHKHGDRVRRPLVCVLSRTRRERSQAVRLPAAASATAPSRMG